MSDDPLDRAALVLGLAGLAGTLFALTSDLSANYDLVLVADAAVVVIPTLGLVAVLGGALGRRVLVVVAGVGYGASALLQLGQFGRDTNWLAGDGSTVALLAALGIGLLAVGLPPRDPSGPGERDRHA